MRIVATTFDGHSYEYKISEPPWSRPREVVSMEEMCDIVSQQCDTNSKRHSAPTNMHFTNTQSTIKVFKNNELIHEYTRG